MSETTPAKLEYGGFREFLPFKDTLEKVFGWLYKHGYYESPTGEEENAYWKSTCGNAEQMDAFIQQALSFLAAGVYSLDGTDLQHADVVCGTEGKLLNQTMLKQKLQPCDQTISKAADAIKRRVREAIETGVIWEAAPGPGKYNRMTLRKLDNYDTPCWELGLNVTKPNTPTFTQHPPLFLENVEESELARIFDRSKPNWWTEQELLGTYEGWDKPEKNVAGSTFTFKRSCDITVDGQTKKLIWKGSHKNPDDPKMEGPYEINDSLSLE